MGSLADLAAGAAANGPAMALVSRLCKGREQVVALPMFSSFSVLGGIGAALLPDFLCRAHIRSGQLVEVLPGWGPAPAICHAMYPARRAMVPAVRALIDFLANNLNGAEPLALDF